MPPPDVENLAELIHGAQARPEGLFLAIGKLWVRVATRQPLLMASICVLLDDEHSQGTFAETYTAHWPGDPADNSAPMDIEGGTDCPIVAALMHRWLDMQPQAADVIPLPVPTLAEATVALPGLWVRRHAAL